MYRAVDRFEQRNRGVDPAGAGGNSSAGGGARGSRRPDGGWRVLERRFIKLALFNSRGLEAHHEETAAEFSITMLQEGSSGWAKQTSTSYPDLEPEVLADRAARKALESQEPKDLAPGKYCVILEPAAVLDLLGFLFFDFGGLAVQESRSCLTGRVGEKIFGENMSVRDDVFHPLQAGAPFDGEGVPRQRV